MTLTDTDAPIPAATLVLMRPAALGPPELLMMERTADMAFAAGALVFPGGRIDADDHAVSDLIGTSGPVGAARVAAIRETIEETGLFPALANPLEAGLASRIRQELDDGTPFSALIEAYRLSFDFDALTPFARWCPNFKEARRFDTYFFLAAAPADAAEASAAPAEAVRTLWGSAAEILDEIAAGRARAIFPTRRNLERLARFGSLDEALADASRHPVRKVVPWIEDREGRRWLCIPDDLGYPVTAEPLETARRF